MLQLQPLPTPAYTRDSTSCVGLYFGDIPFNQPRPVLPQAMPLKLAIGRTWDRAITRLQLAVHLGCRSTKAKIVDILQQHTLPGQLRIESIMGRPIISSCFHSFIHSCFLGRWANHDHLTSSLKHIIKQTSNFSDLFSTFEFAHTSSADA